jgi:hypothetical protein
VVEGVENGEKLIRTLQPAVVIPLNNSDGSYEGAVAPAITSAGSNEKAAVQDWIDSMGFGEMVTVAAPEAFGEPVDVFI